MGAEQPSGSILTASLIFNMRAAIILLLIGLAAAAPQGFGGRSRGPSFRSGGGGGPCGLIRSVYGNQQRRNWGPKAYGLGLNNPCAIPPNPFFMQRAISLANRVPGTLVRVDPNGEIELTDQFGREANIIDAFGRDLTEGLEF